MALRIRKNGKILCAAMHKAEDGDVYINDGVHYYLSAIQKIIVTEPMERHKDRGEWWWKWNIPKGIKIDDFYLTKEDGMECPNCGSINVNVLKNQCYDCNHDWGVKKDKPTLTEIAKVITQTGTLSNSIVKNKTVVILPISKLDQAAKEILQKIGEVIPAGYFMLDSDTEYRIGYNNAIMDTRVNLGLKPLSLDELRQSLGLPEKEE